MSDQSVSFEQLTDDVTRCVFDRPGDSSALTSLYMRILNDHALEADEIDVYVNGIIKYAEDFSQLLRQSGIWQYATENNLVAVFERFDYFENAIIVLVNPASAAAQLSPYPPRYGVS